MSRLVLVVLALLAVGCGGPSSNQQSPGGGGGSDQPNAPVIESFQCSPAAGEAPLTTTCVLAVSEPTNRPLSCALDMNGDGTPEYTLEGCNRSSFQAHVYPVSGTFEARLTVTGEGGQREARFPITVSPARPNQPPTINALAANPAKGVQPLNTALTWNISDPDGDAFRCLFDLRADGSIDRTVDNCQATGSQSFLFTSVGTFDVVMYAEDARGAKSYKSVVVTVDSPATLDLRISRTEWGQSTMTADPKLVQGKPALFRAHVLADKPSTSAVPVQVEGSAGGTSLGTLTLAGPSTFPTSESAADLAQSFRAMIPESWIVPGLTLTIKVDPANAVPETNETNNTLNVTPRVGQKIVLHLTAVPVTQQGLTGTVPSFQTKLWEQWPLQSTSSQTRAAYTFSGQLVGGSSSAWSTLLNELSSLRNTDGSKRYYFGFVRVSYTSGVAGIGYVGSPVACGRHDSLDTMVHELGHNFGRNHAPCGVSGDPNYPYAGAKIGTWGYNLTSQKLVNPTTYYDTMSYCDPTWVSDYSYNGVQSFLEGRPPQPLVSQGAPAPYVLVAGRLTQAGLELRPVQRFVGRPLPVEPGPYELTLTSGRDQHTVAFDMLEVADAEDGERHFSLAVPDLGPLDELEVRGLGKTLLHRARHGLPSPTFPTSAVEHEQALSVSWDSRALPYAMVAHVADGGERTTLALYLTGGSATLPTRDLPAGGHFEVSVSNGLSALRSEHPR